MTYFNRIFWIEGIAERVVLHCISVQFGKIILILPGSFTLMWPDDFQDHLRSMRVAFMYADGPDHRYHWFGCVFCCAYLMFICVLFFTFVLPDWAIFLLSWGSFWFQFLCHVFYFWWLCYCCHYSIQIKYKVSFLSLEGADLNHCISLEKCSQEDKRWDHKIVNQCHAQ